MRIGGLATGMDTDKMIQEMLKPYKMRLDKTNQDKQILQWQQEIYKDIIKDTRDLKSKYFDILNKDNYLLSNNSYYGVKVDTEDKLANILADSSAKAGKYKLSIEKIAKSAKMSSDGKVEKSEEAIKGTKLSQLGIVKDSKLSLRYVNDIGEETITTITIDNKEMTIEELQNKINTETGSKVQLEIKGNTVKLVGNTNFEDSTGIMSKLASNMNTSLSTRLDDLGIKVGDKFTIDYTGLKEPIEITRTANMESVAHLIVEVSKQTKGEVTLSFNELSGEFSFETKNTGSEVKLNLSDKSGKVLEALNIKKRESTGENAKINITEPDGTNAEVVKNVNKFTINGITYDLKETSVENSGKDMEFTVTRDTQKGVDLIKGFIEDYNKLVEKTNKLTTQKKNYKFPPLTDDQKKDMKEEDIKRWEEKAKEGIIKGDPYIEKMMRELRNVFFQKVEGNDTSLQAIGINTTKNYLDGGKLAIDEKKLEKAFTEDPEKVIELFTKKSTTYPIYDPDLKPEQRKVKNSEQGIFNRISDIIEDYARTGPNSKGYRGILLEKAGLEGNVTEKNNVLSKSINQKDKIILDQTRKLKEREDRLYMQFAQLEKAMNALNSQQAWFAQQMGGGQ